MRGEYPQARINMLKATVTVVLIICASTLLSLGRAATKEDSKSLPGNLTTAENNQDDTNDDSSAMPELIAVMNECNETFRIEMAYLEALDESGSFPDETDRTPKCYIRCVLENIGVASKDGQFDPQMTREVFAGEKGGKEMDDVQQMAATCANRKESCKCERSYQFMKCLMESEIKEYLMIM